MNAQKICLRCCRSMLLDLQIVNPVEFSIHTASNLRADGVDFVSTIDTVDRFLPHILTT